MIVLKDELRVKGIKNINGRIEYVYDINGKWTELLDSNNGMFVEYKEDIINIPVSIAIIPFLTNILPMAWIFDLNIFVEEIDKTFLESIPNIKKGYIDMYPKIDFKGNLTVNKIVENRFSNHKSAVLFSGGVDAFNTLINHIDEKPDLLTIMGADISLDDKKGIDVVNRLHSEIANEFDLEYKTIFSNFRTTIKYGALTKKVKNLCGKEWWHDFQHGIALLGLTVPLAFKREYSKIYIASSFTKSDVGSYTCASDPTIDNHFKHSSTITIHDGFEFNRQDKIRNICNYVRNNNVENIKLRVCWMSSGGKNCCECEKCYRTIMGIIAEGENPENYNLNMTETQREKMIKYLKENIGYDMDNNKFRYKPIQKRFIEKYKDNKCPSDLEWFKNIRISEKKPNVRMKMNRFLKKIKNKIFRMRLYHNEKN